MNVGPYTDCPLPPRPLAEIDSDLKACTDRIKQMIEGLSA